ncbi:MAG: hypothetical protein AAF191_17885 [Verrucomicrobiota bacterium]
MRTEALIREVKHAWQGFALPGGFSSMLSILPLTIRVALRVFPRTLMRAWGFLRGQQVLAWREMRCRSHFIGGLWSGRTVHLQGLDDESVAYSVGLGKNLSFELALIRRTGCEVHAFESDPEVVEWIQEQEDLPAQFHFHPWKISDALQAEHCQEECPSARTLDATLQLLGHHRPSLLKMDATDRDCEVLEAMLREEAPFAQLIIAFRRMRERRQKVRKLLNWLWADGFRVYSIDSGGCEFGLRRMA